MDDTIKRQKIVERERFTYEEKEKLAEKSDRRCCHCGKKLSIKDTTVEHFIPLSKGGTNRDINLVALCFECNDSKNNFIYRPNDYLTYLKEEHLEKLNGYFESYIHSFDFVNRDNLLACDRYKVFVNRMRESLYLKTRKSKNRDKIEKKFSVPLWVKKATYEDVNKLTEYYIKYLKKYDCLDSEKSAKINIEFWITFGCIYYIENKGQIEGFITITVTKSNGLVFVNDDNIDYFLTVNIFTYYSNDYALTLAWNLSRQIPRYIAYEQDLQQIPIKFNVLANDSLHFPLCEGGVIKNEDRFISSFMILFEGEKEDLTYIKEDEKLESFFKKFEKINEERLKVWFNIHRDEPYEWMLNELELLV